MIYIRVRPSIAFVQFCLFFLVLFFTKPLFAGKPIKAIKKYQQVSRASGTKSRYVALVAQECESFLSEKKALFFGDMLAGEKIPRPLGIVYDAETQKSFRFEDFFPGVSWIVEMNLDDGYAVIKTGSPKTSLADYYFFDFSTKKKTSLTSYKNENYSLEKYAFSPDKSQMLLIDKFSNQKIQVVVRSLKQPKNRPEVDELTLLAASNLGPSNKVSDDGQTLALHLSRERTGYTLIAHKKGPEERFSIAEAPGFPVYLSPNGRILITRTSRTDFSFFSISSMGELTPIKLNDLQRTVDSFWEKAAPDGNAFSLNAVAIESVKISKDNQWIAVHFEHDIYGKGIRGGAVVRWSLTQTQNSPKTVHLKPGMKFDYLVNDLGTVLIAQANADEILFTRSDQEKKKLKIPYRSLISDHYQYLHELRFINEGKSVALRTESGILVVELMK